MKTKTLEKATLSKGMRKSGKVPYSSPVFRVYGSVAQLTKGKGGTLADGNSGNTRVSDRNLKDNILKVGDHPLGVGLYLFDYKNEYRETCGYGRQFGVMADEIEAVLPEAVSLHPHGYKQVNYAMLGISHNVG